MGVTLREEREAESAESQRWESNAEMENGNADSLTTSRRGAGATRVGPTLTRDRDLFSILGSGRWHLDLFA